MINPRLRSGASGEARLHSLLATTIDKTSVLPLPTEQQWRDATAHDFDLNAISCALRNSTPLRRADLRAKGYFHPFAEKQLVVENGIVYNYGRSKHLNTRAYNCEWYQNHSGAQYSPPAMCPHSQDTADATGPCTDYSHDFGGLQ
jgi:hypothetical protein